MCSEIEALQVELQRLAVTFLVEAKASAVALALQKDPEGYWIAIGPKSQIPFLLGAGDSMDARKARDPEREASATVN